MLKAETLIWLQRANRSTGSCEFVVSNASQKLRRNCIVIAQHQSMVPSSSRLTLAIVILLASSSCGALAQVLEVESARREISLATQVAVVSTKFTLKNAGKQAAPSFEFCYRADHINNAAVVEVVQGIEDGAPLQLTSTATGSDKGIACLTANLQKPIQAGKTDKVRVSASFTGLQTPFPASIFQNEPQRVLYLDTMYILSPYKIHKQTTKVSLPAKNIESYTKVQPVSLSQGVLNYGEYEAKDPFTVEELRLHFENNTPFAVATRLMRETEISHWGNVYIEEHYTIKHKGPKIRGEWSRLDLMVDPVKFGQTALRGFLAHLPAGAHSIYFKDAIGNISTSQIRPNVQMTEVILTPRYPLYGGWQAEFILGYSLRLQDVVSRNPRTGSLTAISLFGSSLAGVIVDNIENRIVLPEGSTVLNVDAPFLVERSNDTKYTYLDVEGRPVVVVKKSNVVFEHNIGFTVSYSFSQLSLLREPLLLIGVFLLFFAIVILYCRCNFVLTRGSAWEAENKAERTAFLVEEITSIIAGREKAVLSASSGQGEDVEGLLRSLKQTETKLNARCRDLESLAGLKHSAIVRDLLEKEKAVQARIARIAAARGQPQQADTVQQGLQEVSASLQQEHASRLGQLS